MKYLGIVEKKKEESESHSVVSNSLQSYGLQPTRLLCPWDSPGKNTGVGSHSLLQGVFPTQGSNQGVLHCRQILCHPSHQGSLWEDLYIYNYETMPREIKKDHVYESEDHIFLRCHLLYRVNALSIKILVHFSCRN